MIGSQTPNPAKLITLERHISEGERSHPGATGEFSGLLHGLSLAAKLVWREVTKAGLVNILGPTDRMNISGDVVKKLDEFADQTIYRAMDHLGHLCVMASEENEDLLQIPVNYPAGKYVLLYDPLDGSGNIDANITIGTIFSIYRRVSSSGPGTMEDVLQPGHRQVAAGYRSRCPRVHTGSERRGISSVTRKSPHAGTWNHLQHKRGELRTLVTPYATVYPVSEGRTPGVGPPIFIAVRGITRGGCAPDHPVWRSVLLSRRHQKPEREAQADVRKQTAGIHRGTSRGGGVGWHAAYSRYPTDIIASTFAAVHRKQGRSAPGGGISFRKAVLTAALGRLSDRRPLQNDTLPPPVYNIR
jgi:hypothetical protein